MPVGYATPQEVDDQIIELRLKTKLTNREIAARFEISMRTVERALNRGRKRGIDIPKAEQPDPITPEEEARILSLLEDGVPYAEVGRTMGRNASRLGEKYPGYRMSFSELASINHMQRKFEQLLEALGLDDTAHYSH